MVWHNKQDVEHEDQRKEKNWKNINFDTKILRVWNRLRVVSDSWHVDKQSTIIENGPQHVKVFQWGLKLMLITLTFICYNINYKQCIVKSEKANWKEGFLIPNKTLQSIWFQAMKKDRQLFLFYLILFRLLNNYSSQCFFFVWRTISRQKLIVFVIMNVFVKKKKNFCSQAK